MIMAMRTGTGTTIRTATIITDTITATATSTGERMKKAIARTILAPLAAALLMGAAARAQSDEMPAGALTFVLPFAAGGPVDAVARLLAERLSPRLERTIVVENKTGAGGDVAAGAVARSAPDGRTWFFTVDSVLTVNPHMNAASAVNPADLTAVAKVGEVVLLLAVNPRKVAATTFAELVALSGKQDLSFGSAGLGSPGHMAFQYLQVATGMKGVHVPYRGAALVLQDMLGGNIDASFIVSGVLAPHVNAGTLRALAVSANYRLKDFPDVPTAQEAGIKDFEARFANILIAPARTDPKILARMEKETLAAANTPDFIAKLANLSTEPQFGGRDVAAAWLTGERARWGRVINAASPK